MLCTYYSKNKYVKRQIEIVPKWPNLWGMQVDWNMSHLWDIWQPLMCRRSASLLDLLSDPLWLLVPVGYLLLVGQLVDWSIGRFNGWLVGWLAGRLVYCGLWWGGYCWLLGPSVLSCCLVSVDCWLVDRLVIGWSFVCDATQWWPFVLGSSQFGQ